VVKLEKLKEKEFKTTAIWVKGEWVDCIYHAESRLMSVQTGIVFVRDPETMHWVSEAEMAAIRAEPKPVPVTRPGFSNLKLKKQERRSVQIIGERPFSVDYGNIREDDPHADDIHELASDPNGFTYEYRKLDDEDFIRPILVNIPKKEISQVPQDHSRYTEHMGKNTRAFKRA
jgi:hypothetical protein